MVTSQVLGALDVGAPGGRDECSQMLRGIAVISVDVFLVHSECISGRSFQHRGRTTQQNPAKGVCLGYRERPGGMVRGEEAQENTTQCGSEWMN